MRDADKMLKTPVRKRTFFFAASMMVRSNAASTATTDIYKNQMRPSGNLASASYILRKLSLTTFKNIKIHSPKYSRLIIPYKKGICEN